MRAGIYIEDLSQIRKPLQERYMEFMRKYMQSDGRVVIMWDGVIRRGEFIGIKGTFIPSQIKQINDMFNEVNEQLGLGICLGGGDLVLDATHIVIDIQPEDAEAQLRRRARLELQNIREAIAAKLHDPSLNKEEAERISRIYERFGALDAMIIGGIPRGESDTYSRFAMDVRISMAKEVGLPDPAKATFQKIFAVFGIETGLRDDDIDPVGRHKRGENYLAQTEGHRAAGRQRRWLRRKEGGQYAPGFAAQALIEGLRFWFGRDGRMHVPDNQENRIVVENGQGRGYTLERFKQACVRVADAYCAALHVPPVDLEGVEGRYVSARVEGSLVA